MFEVIVFTNKGTNVGSFLGTNERACVLGKDKSCSVVLQGWKVGKQHAEIYRGENGGIYIRGLNGYKVLVNGVEKSDYGPLKKEDEIGIHSYRITVNPMNESVAVASTSSDVKEEVLDDADAKEKNDDSGFKLSKQAEDDGSVEKPPVAKAHNKLAMEWQIKLHDALLQNMDLRRIDVHSMSDDKLTDLTRELLDGIVRNLTEFPESLDKKEITARVLSEAVGLGPLEELLAEESISEIMVNASDEIFYERQGKIYKSDIVFSSDKAVIYAIERIVAPLGRRIDESSPMVDARLKDGSRVNAIIPPLALKGPSITIRKFMKEKLTGEHLVGFGSASTAMMVFLDNAVKHKQNIVMSGGTGSGKTTLLNVLSNFIPNHERIVTVEDSAELKLYQPNLVSLEGRPPNQEGKGEVALRDLVKNCLRMRPDRIVVGECRSGEALDMLQAMNTGHDGSLTTVHANTPQDCVSRIEIMVMMAGMDLPSIAIREQISSAVHLIVQQTRFPCGARKISEISEVTGIEGSRVQIGSIFKYIQEGYDADGNIKGRFVATGLIPRFYETLKHRGIDVDFSVFDKEATA
ncbi:MAG: Flp pilus assembly complex ATPase component TadA [Thiomicrorhabdus sp.]|nr:Flp pilus assembly complex ATPase component TadA [Thiomicrorhabdus sp.]